MLNTSTMKTNIKFGDKVEFSYIKKPKYSTAVYFDEMTLIQSFSGCIGQFTPVDYSDQKKMEIYRKINEMLDGR